MKIFPYVYIVIIIAAGVGILAYFVGNWRGYNDRKKDDQQTAAIHASELQGTYANGIRVGKRQMLDELVHAGLITEDAAEAIAGELH